MVGFTWILSPGGAVTLDLYMDVGDPTFVTTLLKTRLITSEREVESANEGEFRSQTVPLKASEQLLLSPEIIRRTLLLYPCPHKNFM